ncbi:14881_t:CDS:1, partial [Acaulospora colombiana]
TNEQADSDGIKQAPIDCLQVVVIEDALAWRRYESHRKALQTMSSNGARLLSSHELCHQHDNTAAWLVYLWNVVDIYLTDKEALDDEPLFDRLFLSSVQ